MNILELGKIIIILHNTKRGNNYFVANILANHFNCCTFAAEDNPSLLEFNTIVIVLSNTGDEELPQPMEDYLFNLNVRDKKYILCELGNHFGFENYFGCKNVAIKILSNLGWTKLTEVSLDTVPKIVGLNEWIKTLPQCF